MTTRRSIARLTSTVFLSITAAGIAGLLFQWDMRPETWRYIMAVWAIAGVGWLFTVEIGLNNRDAW